MSLEPNAKPIGPIMVPPVVMLAAMFVCWSLYFSAPVARYEIAHAIAANVGFWGYTLSIVAGILWIYPAAASSGVGFGGRLALCLINPGLWALKEAYMVGSIHGAGSGVYFFFFAPLNITVYCLVAIALGIAHLRYLRKNGERSGRGRAIGAIAGGAVLSIGMFAWGYGVHAFYLFQSGYKVLFH